MGGDTGRLRQEIEQRLRRAGALAVGVAAAGKVDTAARKAYERWLNSGGAAGMAYMHAHQEIRQDPRLLLEGARSVVCMAFGYKTGATRDPGLPRISAYALLPDYHNWIKQAVRMSGINSILGEEGSDWRICVDSAPIMERYWAVRAGIGILGENGAVIVPGVGSEVFLAELITLKELEPDHPLAGDCGRCGKCSEACPTGALQTGGTIDCGICLSYLTIEHKGEWSEPRQKAAMRTTAGRNTLFGCDRCLSACPHNIKTEGTAPDTPAASDDILTLTAEDILRGDTTSLSARLKGSCLRRAKLNGLMRNAQNIGTVSSNLTES